ncbi:MAG: hypothetical protein ACE5GL_10545, partial [Calditrichia bacterium]
MHELKKFIRQVIKYFSSLLFTVYSFTIGILTQRGRYLHSIICHYYGFDFLKPTLPLISWEEVMGNETIELREIKVRPGNMPVDELALICGIVR